MRLLIVDGHEEICALVEVAFRDCGFDVVAAYSIRQAHEILTHDTFDVVILASVLPDGSGLRLCDELRDRLGIQAVIIMTALDRKQTNPVVAFELGADDFVVMPFDFTELELRITAHVRRRRNSERYLYMP